MERPLVSVVTPVHNGEKHLAECIESVVAQTYENWSYVVVDNCSSDRTREIAESYARTDERIRYARHDEFVDVIASYNRAFRTVSANGTYCKVVGADDWLYPECLDRMVEVAEASPNIGVVGAYRLKGARVDLGDLPHSVSVAPGREIIGSSLLSRVSVIGSATSILFRSDLVRRREPFYDESFRHADTEAAFWVLIRSEFGFVHQILTFTRVSESGQTEVSERLNSQAADKLRMLVRYGPATVPEDEYRRELRRQLREYVSWQFKQYTRLSRRRDHHFQAFHRDAVELLLAEAPTDPDVRRAAAVLHHLVRRRRQARSADSPAVEVPV